MGKPIIGLTPSWNKTTCVVIPMQETYLDAVRAAGGEPLVLDVAAEEGARAELAACDALISTGGGDIAPERYGEARIESCGRYVLRCRLTSLGVMPVIALTTLARWDGDFIPRRRQTTFICSEVCRR